MSGQAELPALLRSMTPQLQDGEFVFCSVTQQDLARSGITPLSFFHEQEGISLIVRREQALAGQFAHTYVARMITLTVHSSLEAVGFLAKITAELARAGVSVNTISAYYHDHLFVPTERAEEAMQILRALSERYHDVLGETLDTNGSP